MKHTEENYTITNARAVVENRILENAVITVRFGIIESVTQNKFRPTKKNAEFPVFDADGAIAGPGLIDMHIHGCGGTDTTQEDMEQSLLQMADFLSERGITSFQPTMVMNTETLNKTALALKNNPALAKRLPGVYVEGPFLCPEKKGGLPADTIRECSPAYAREIVCVTAPVSCGERSLVKTIVVAPELAGSVQVEHIFAESGILVSWGHSNAHLRDVANKKPRHLTHLFNAMNGIDHRNPGLAVLPFTKQGADATFEIICDTVHVHPALLEMVFSSAAAQNACIISDCMSSGGLGSGESLYLDKTVVCDGRVSRYKENGVLIGSAMLVADTARELFAKGLIDERLFFRAASSNPACALGMSDRGILAAQKKADIVLCNASMEITDVFTH